MATNSINLTIHETYDLNTKVDAVTLLAIRTPSYDTVAKYVDIRNWSKIKFNRASFRLACVSQLPVDPLGVGFEAGQIAPQELVNPMLFKTVTGESLGNILDVIYGNNNATQDDGDSLKALESKEVVVTALNSSEPSFSTSPLDMYYVLLGDDSFRQAHPQAGLTANNLIPLVREMYTTMPLGVTPTGKVGQPGENTTNNNYQVPLFDDETGRIWANWGDVGLTGAQGRIISGATRPMPAIDTLAGSKLNNAVQSWPMAYCAVCVMPPAIQKSLYYRCIVSWNITLSGFVPNFRLNAYVGTERAHIYKNWMDVPVDSNTAAAMELWDDGGLIATDGVENVTMVTQNLT